MRNKKAAIELSVTAIVILILAIVMLGLGLGFIRGMFGKVTTTMEEQIAAEPEPSKPSSSDLITLSRERIILNAGNSAAVKVSIYNSGSADLSAQPQLTCASLTLSPTTPVGNARLIPVGDFRTFSVLFTIPSSTVAKSALCKVAATSAADAISKDLTITVK